MIHFRFCQRKSKTAFIVFFTLVVICALHKDVFLPLFMEPRHMVSSTRTFTSQSGDVLSGVRTISRQTFLNRTDILNTNLSTSKPTNLKSDVSFENGSVSASSGGVLNSTFNFALTEDGNVTSVLNPGRQKKVLVLAYYRSGSSLTGSLFDHQLSTFYSFEPLHALHFSMQRGHRLLYFDGKSRPVPSADTLDNASLEVLKAFYNCDFASLDWRTMTGGFNSRSVAYKSYVQCVKTFWNSSNNVNEVGEVCIPILTKKCEESEALVLKTIRVRMTLAERLLKYLPDLKIIHVHRDARGMACSLRGKRCMSAILSSDSTCTMLNGDERHKQFLNQKYPGRIYDMKYEDLVQDPVKVVRDMFKFVEIELTADVVNWIHESLLSGQQVKGPMALMKMYPLATAYKWTQRIRWEVVDIYQRLCSSFLEMAGYPVFTNIENVRNVSVPFRNVSQLENELKRITDF